MLEINLESDPLSETLRNDTVSVLYELARQVPGQPVTIVAGRERLLLLQDRGRIRHVLVSNADNYLKNFGGFEMLFGRSRFTTDGDIWRQLQAISQPYIAGARPAEVVTASVTAFERAADRLLAAGPGPVVIDSILNRATGDVIADVTFGDHGLDIENTVEDLRNVLRFGSQLSWNIGSLSALDDQDERRVVDASRTRLAQSITAALERSGTMVGASGLLKSIFEMEIEGSDPVAEVAALLFAGLDTSAAAMVWGLFLLANSPDLQNHLRQHVRGVLGNGPPTLEMLQQIPDLAAFRDEVMRIFPPVPMLGRIAVAGDAVDGVQIDPGQRVLLSIVGLHHDPQTFPRPGQVQLSRYKSGRLDGAAAQSHMSFGGGKRICAGVRIGNVELLTAFAVLLSRVEVKLADLSPLKFEWTASLRRRGGQRLMIAAAR